jgi:hypothetical protein
MCVYCHTTVGQIIYVYNPDPKSKNFLKIVSLSDSGGKFTIIIWLSRHLLIHQLKFSVWDNVINSSWQSVENCRYKNDTNKNKQKQPTLNCKMKKKMKKLIKTSDHIFFPACYSKHTIFSWPNTIPLYVVICLPCSSMVSSMPMSQKCFGVPGAACLARCLEQVCIRFTISSSERPRPW